tara:strand:- start:1199 stop:2248 length:1050 start_codon:yes stop_codon:yes gene_type:complete
MKIAIITDQHFGARKGSKLFHEYFKQFYDDIFFPTLEKEGITTVVDMGDTFDNRRGIDFWALDWAKEHYFDRLRDMGITVHTIVGNHTAYYKNTNEINTIGLLLSEYENIICYDKATEIKLDKLNTLLIPWINPENEEETHDLINRTKCNVAMGHLELTGFNANKYVVMEHGADRDIYEKFDQVFSGHYHTRSQQDNIHYLGNPYEIYWTDVDDERGFHLYDTDTLELTPIRNPYKMFHNVYYEDSPHQLIDTSKYKDKIIKIIVRKKSNTSEFEKFVDKFYSSNVYDVKIVENFDFVGYYDVEEFESEESEDTISILNRYIDEAEVSLDKSIVKNLLKEVYMEACEVG